MNNLSACKIRQSLSVDIPATIKIELGSWAVQRNSIVQCELSKMEMKFVIQNNTELIEYEFKGLHVKFATFIKTTAFQVWAICFLN